MLYVEIFPLFVGHQPNTFSTSHDAFQIKSSVAAVTAHENAVILFSLRRLTLAAQKAKRLISKLKSLPNRCFEQRVATVMLTEAGAVHYGLKHFAALCLRCSFPL
jgi:hypothetical protein